MSDFKIPVEKTVIALDSKRDVNLTMPWFSQKSKYPPRAGNVVHPLINGQRTFAAVHEALAAAKKSIDIISWGFDPSMRLVRPNGQRVGDLLRQKAAAGIEVRVLVWKSAIANLVENNIIGDGLFGSGGGSAGGGSGMGSTKPGDAKATDADGFNDYGAKKSGTTSGAVQFDDPQAKAFNREWFSINNPKLSFRTREFSTADQQAIAKRNYDKRGLGAFTQHVAFVHGASHHQKAILVDYELTDAAVGFVMGHNLLRNYWDNDTHEYFSELRLGFAPWQDLSSRVYGPVLFDLNENFCSAWTKAQPWIGSDQPISAARLQVKPSAFEASAAKRGSAGMAQICRTQPQENDQSILDAYKLALSAARNYVYFENQYFRSTELAMLMREVRRKLKSAGWKRDFYIFVVTNVPDGSGRLNTYDTMAALGKSNRMPAIEKSKGGGDAESADSKALRRRDLEGVNIHVCTLCSSGTRYTEAQAYDTGFTDDMGFPEVRFSEPSARTVYKDIYVHSKLLLVDDVFFTLGSANANVRSMEVDSELNIAMPSPGVTQEWRRHLWKIHTGRAPSDDPKEEFKFWANLMGDNGDAKATGSSLKAPLIEFYDDAKSGSRAD
ncbi:MAG: hypothetical protein H7Z15_08540 [Rhizobacter sp.]|nr:hypothetical protein [Rhizobacter sp.]